MASLFVDDLTVIDFSYLDPERGILGESWIVDLVLGGDLNNEGMVFDFGHVKKTVKAEIDRTLDHTFVVPRALPGLRVTPSTDRLDICLPPAPGRFGLDYSAPAAAVTLLDTGQVTPEAVRQAIEQRLRSVLPANVNQIQLTLRPEVIDGDWYHYSHGLKKHAGDCQRLIHGHRSRIQVFRDGQRWPEQEAEIARNWRDSYLVTAEDIVREHDWDGVHCYDIAYRANQGHFALTLPAHHCITFSTDTTVELIAQELAHQASGSAGKASGYVRAYEGVNKGAIAYWPAAGS